jgi:hypothetical protein
MLCYVSVLFERDLLLKKTTFKKSLKMGSAVTNFK